MDFLQDIWTKAKKLNKKIVLPETEDTRTIKAADFILKSRLAQVILVGQEDSIQSSARENNSNISQAQIINPLTYSGTKDFSSKFKVKREKKGMTDEKAYEIMTTDYPFFGAMLIDQGFADGMVTGASHPTANTMHATLQCLGTAPNITIVSSFFAMISPKKEFGEEGLMFYADCGVNPNPNADELAQIATETAQSFKALTGLTPRIAMLSFSTKGSAKHADVDKVVKATQIVKEKSPELIIDGELQLDAALIPSIGKRKAPGSQVAGYANILIFPDLDAGNIGYKLTERLGGAVALGPLLQGCKKPVNDLSRGCSVEDIVNVTAITAVQTQS